MKVDRFAPALGAIKHVRPVFNDGRCNGATVSAAGTRRKTGDDVRAEEEFDRKN